MPAWWLAVLGRKGMGTIVALTNSKGGVEKSTVAVHLAAWCHQQGRRTVLVDADAQASSSVWLHEAVPELAICRLQTPDEILDQVPRLAAQSDVLLVDGPAGLSEVTRAVLLVTHLALLPCGPSVLDLRAVQEAIRVVHQAQRIRGGPPQAVLVPNKLQVQYRLTQELLATVPSLGVPVLGGLRLRQAFADAAGQGTLVWRLGPRGSAATEELLRLFEELNLHDDETHHESGVARE
jgi:chromosome partitioning protein